VLASNSLSVLGYILGDFFTISSDQPGLICVSDKLIHWVSPFCLFVTRLNGKSGRRFDTGCQVQIITYRTVHCMYLCKQGDQMCL
jgi:hypothetical protein